MYNHKQYEHYITFGTRYSDAETTWKRYEYLCQILIDDCVTYKKDHIGIIIFLTKRHHIAFVLQCVGKDKENNTYLFTRYMIPFYDRYEADILLHVASDSFDEELDVKTNKIAFSNKRFLIE